MAAWTLKISQGKTFHSWALPLFISLIFVVISLFLSKNQPVFADEPGYTDPAASFVFAQGFTSGAWYSQNDNHFFAGNVPLHELLLIPWLKVLGFGLLQARAINLVYTLTGVWLIYNLLSRTGWVKSEVIRLGMVSLLLFGETSYFLNQLGRPDGITFFLACFGLWLLTVRSTLLRLFLLFLVGFLSTWAGLQLVAAWAILGLIALCFFRMKYLPETAALGAGSIAGLAGLYILYQYHGVWQDFLKSVFPHTMTASRSKYSFTGFYGDRSFVLIALGAALLFSECWRNTDHQCRLASRIGSALLLALPAGLLLLGKFPAHYTWIPGLAVLFCAAILLDKTLLKQRSLFRAALILLALAFLAGYPRRVAVALIHGEDDINGKTEAFVRQYIHRNDHVIYSTQAYYGVKKIAARTYYQNWYPAIMTKDEAEKVTALVIEPGKLDALTRLLGSGWKAVGAPLPVPIRRFPNKDLWIELQVYRKEP